MLALHMPEGAAFTFLVLFAVVLAGPAIMTRARIPGIIGLLIGGWAIGPHGLGLIGNGNQTVPQLGQLGLLYLMFVAGLELDLGVLSVYRRSAVAFSLITFTLPFVGGLVVGEILGFPTAAAVLLGSLLASHTLITYPMIRDAGLSGNPAVATAVGATVLTDTISLVVLAGVSGTQTGSGSTGSIFLQLALGLAVLVGFSLLVLPRVAVWIYKRLGADRSVRFLVAMISFLAAATLAEVFSIEGIVGAFFAGLALNRLVPNEGQTMHRIDFFGSTVFVPIFLVSTGLLLDPSVMFRLETMKFAGLFLLACVGGKTIATVLSRTVIKVSWHESGLMFVLTTPQAAATLAATTVGFEIGLFSTTVVNAVLVLILVSIVMSTALTPPFVRGVEVPAAAEPELGERVVLAVHAAEPSRTATQIAARLARRDGGVVDTVLVRHSGEGRVDRGPVDALSDLATREGFDGEVHVAIDRSSAQAVVRAANDLGASLVVVDGDLDGDDGPLGATHWDETLASTIPVPLVLVSSGGDGIRRVLLPRADPDQVEPAAAFVQALAQFLARGDVAELDDGPDWAAGLRPGDVVVMAVASVDLVVGLPSPPPGAAVVAVPASTVAHWHPHPDVAEP
jgi:Kef-type K+ transport system membrane component KefB